MQETLNLEGNAIALAIAEEMLRLFKGDARRVMQQLSSGGYRPLHTGALTSSDLVRHLMGNISASIYLLDEHAQCSTLCFDIDIPKLEIPSDPALRDEKKRAEYIPVAHKIADYVEAEYGVDRSAMLLEDTGGRGYHVWLFSSVQVDAREAVAFLSQVRDAVGREQVEIFPPVSQHGKKGFSKSNVRLPLGLHRAYPGARSRFLNWNDAQPVPSADVLDLLQALTYLSPDVFKLAYDSLEQKRSIQLQSSPPPPTPGPDRQRVPYGEVGDLFALCPALQSLLGKAMQQAHLLHHERVALALTLLPFADGSEMLRRILSHCSDFDEQVTRRHFESLSGYSPLSCRALQGPNYALCPGWCCQHLADAYRTGHSPSPVWFARLNVARDTIVVDRPRKPLIEQISEIKNLYQAWQQAAAQAKERDVFEDVLAYRSFEHNLWANLYALQRDLLAGRWRHQPFHVVAVPKRRDDPGNVRPMCWATPWDAVVALAVLNVIGPPIDSTFHANSLGNRLAHGPRSDSQVFEDWREMNRYREFRRDGFAEHHGCFFMLTDLHRFYEHIRHDRLLALLRARISEPQVLDVIQQYLEAEWLCNGSPLPRTTQADTTSGLPQGPALSAFLSNLYLDDLDDWLDRRCVDFIRYVDDFALVFSSEEESREGIDDLSKLLQREYAVAISDDPEKTKGPLPVSRSTELGDWLRDARYQLGSHIAASRELSDKEKNELRSILTFVSGANLEDDKDRERLVRYLGFYVANTDRLEQPELQRGVYALAAFVLNEERPRHAATSIALRALVKASSEFQDAGWIELSKLLEKRSEEYLKICLCQETRRLKESMGEDLVLHPDLLHTLTSFLTHASPTVAAAAAECLSGISPIEDFCRQPLRDLVFGPDSYVAARAAVALRLVDAIDSNTMARLSLRNGDEFALVLSFLTGEQWLPVVDALASELSDAPYGSNALGALLDASLACTSERGLAACRGMLPGPGDAAATALVHQVAVRHIQRVVTATAAGTPLAALIDLCLGSDLRHLGRQLYDAGRLAKVVASRSDIETRIDSDAAPTDPSSANLPSLPGIELEDLLLAATPGCWVHLGRDSAGKAVVHAVAVASEFAAIGLNASRAEALLSLLRHEDLLVLDAVDTTEVDECLYMLEAAERDPWQSLEAWRTKQDLSPKSIAEMLRRVAVAMRSAQSAVLSHGFSEDDIPVPSFHTLVLSNMGDVRFRTVLPSLVQGRVFIDLDGEAHALPRENWQVYALGLLFFEIVTERSISSALRQGSPRPTRLAETAESIGRGPLFVGIVGKATASRPPSRYDSVGLLADDIMEWATLTETDCGEVLGRPRAMRFSRLWLAQLGIERRFLVLRNEERHPIEVSTLLAEHVVSVLETEGECADEWMAPCFADIIPPSASKMKHVGAFQLGQIGYRIRDQWNSLIADSGRHRALTADVWLCAASASIELEAARRYLYQYARTDLRQKCEALCVRLGPGVSDTHDAQGFFVDVPRAPLTASMRKKLESALPSAAARLLTWIAPGRTTVPSPIWPSDFAAMATLLGFFVTGLRMDYGDPAMILPPASLSSKRRAHAMQTIEALLSLYEFEHSTVRSSIADAEEARTFCSLAALAAAGLQRVALQNRKYASFKASGFKDLYTHALAQLDLADLLGLSAKCFASRPNVLPFPRLDPKHSGGCVFSCDVVTLNGICECTALSLPAVVRRVRNEIRPKYVGSRRAWLRRILVGRWRVFIGRHTWWLAATIAYYCLAVYWDLTGLVVESVWIRVLDKIIPNWLPLLLTGPYLHFCQKRWRRLPLRTDPGNQDDGASPRE